MLEMHGVVACISSKGRFAIGPKLDLFRQIIEEQIVEGNLKIVFDMSDVIYADSAGLGEIIASRRALNDVGGRLALAGAKGKVRDLLELTRLGDLIDTYPVLDEAIASFHPA